MPVELRADQLIVCDRIMTMDPHYADAQALASANGRVLAVGTREEVSRCCGAETQIIEARGTVLPGFIDTHMHLEKIAGEMAMVQFDGARSIADVLARVDTAAARAPAGEWVRCFGDDGAWHERQLAEGRLPLREELDLVGHGHPVFLYRGGDAAAVNSLAAEALATRLSKIGSPGWDERRGWLYGSDVRELHSQLPSPSPGYELDQLRQGSERLLKMGVTTIVDPGMPARFASTWKLYEAALSAGHLAQRVYLMNRLDDRYSLETELERVASGPALPGQGDDQLRAWSVKVLLDGEFANAWMRPGEPASGQPLQRWTNDDIERVVLICTSNGWPLCVHAMGGGAIDAFIDTVASVCTTGAQLAPGQISIAHAFLASRQNARDCKRLGISISVQPMLQYVFESELQDAWGPTADRANPFAMLLEEGVAIAGGSDVLPCEPLRGARLAVDRTSRHGTVLGSAEALDPEDALALFTRMAGPYVGRDDLGTLAPGSVADFVLWNANPFDTDVEQWPELQAQLAVTGGQVAWQA
jgi:predicted amidohydrolase YtcJ